MIWKLKELDIVDKQETPQFPLNWAVEVERRGAELQQIWRERDHGCVVSPFPGLRREDLHLYGPPGGVCRYWWLIVVLSSCLIPGRRGSGGRRKRGRGWWSAAGWWWCEVVEGGPRSGGQWYRRHGRKAGCPLRWGYGIIESCRCRRRRRGRWWGGRSREMGWERRRRRCRRRGWRTEQTHCRRRSGRENPRFCAFPYLFPTSDDRELCNFNWNNKVNRPHPSFPLWCRGQIKKNEELWLMCSEIVRMIIPTMFMLACDEDIRNHDSVYYANR